MSSPNKRRDIDLMKLLMNDYKVDLNNDDMKEFNVEFKGPVDTLYQGGVWKVKVELPDDYPLHSPSIGFANKIYHPNIDELTGAVCMNVFNKAAHTYLVNVFELFLPQLLTVPNPSDPMNDEAAALMINDKATYDARVREYVERYATPEDAGDAEEDKSTDKEASEETSNLGDDASGSGLVEP